MGHTAHLVAQGVAKKAVSRDRSDGDQGDDDNILSHTLTQLFQE